MAYILDGTTLKDPVNFEREQVEIGAEQVTLEGRTTKDIRNRKERYTLEFQYLTSAQASAIFTAYDKEVAVDFQVTETNLTIAATSVHIEIPERLYNKGGDYYENLTVILTEVI